MRTPQPLRHSATTPLARFFASAMPLIIVMTLVLAARPGFAARIIVNDLGDTAGGSTCTLRNAIDAANKNAAVGGCPAGELGRDKVTFDLTGTIILGSSLPPIAEDLVIKGPGAAKLAINGNNVFEAKILQLDAGVWARVAALTVTNGYSFLGAGIANFGGTLEISGCSISRNTGAFGGGIDNDAGTVIVRGTTFSDNRSIWGGGIFNNTGTLVVHNSTFSGNYADEGRSVGACGCISGSGTLTVRNSTFAGNSGGVCFSGTWSMTNTIIANNPGGNCAGVTGGPDNLQFGDTTCTGFTSGDPMLHPLQVRRPGETATFALRAGSAAIDAGNTASCLATDQRGVHRPQGAGCDVGAYEVRASN